MKLDELLEKYGHHVWNKWNAITEEEQGDVTNGFTTTIRTTRSSDRRIAS